MNKSNSILFLSTSPVDHTTLHFLSVSDAASIQIKCMVQCMLTLVEVYEADTGMIYLTIRLFRTISYLHRVQASASEMFSLGTPRVIIIYCHSANSPIA